MKDNAARPSQEPPPFDPAGNGWMSSAEAARYLGLTPDTLRDYRSKGRSPRFFKLGWNVFYAGADLDDWFARRARRAGEGGARSDPERAREPFDH